MVFLPRPQLESLVCPGNGRHDVMKRTLNLGSVLQTAGHKRMHADAGFIGKKLSIIYKKVIKCDYAMF